MTMPETVKTPGVGDWISFDRPDYMWIMKREGFFDDFTRLGEIYKEVQYPAGQQPDFQGM